MTEEGLALWIWTLAGACVGLVILSLVLIWLGVRNTCKHGVGEGEKCAGCAQAVQAVLETEPRRVVWD